jgi:hypothetical protein
MNVPNAALSIGVLLYRITGLTRSTKKGTKYSTTECHTPVTEALK